MKLIGEIQHISCQTNEKEDLQFHVITFSGAGRIAGVRFIATVFAEFGFCAVVNRDEPHMRWLGNRFESELRSAIRRHHQKIRSESVE